jgi:hypothetical protein
VAALLRCVAVQPPVRAADRVLVSDVTERSRHLVGPDRRQEGEASWNPSALSNLAARREMGNCFADHINLSATSRFVRYRGNAALSESATIRPEQTLPRSPFLDNFRIADDQSVGEPLARTA